MKNLKKLSRKQLQTVTGGLGCNPSAGLNCPGNSICCSLSYDDLSSGICRPPDYPACLAPNP